MCVCVCVCGGGGVVDRAAVTTLAGSGIYSFSDGFETNAGFRNPVGVAVDASRNVFVVDQANQRMRKVTAGGGTRIILVTPSARSRCGRIVMSDRGLMFPWVVASRLPRLSHSM